jgi:hypothetical protein
MYQDIKPPIMEAIMEMARYRVPISLWFVEQNQRVKNGGL